jgi:hypothetical protein
MISSSRRISTSGERCGKQKLLLAPTGRKSWNDWPLDVVVVGGRSKNRQETRTDEQKAQNKRGKFAGSDIKRPIKGVDCGGRLFGNRNFFTSARTGRNSRVD